MPTGIREGATRGVEDMLTLKRLGLRWRAARRDHVDAPCAPCFDGPIFGVGQETGIGIGSGFGVLLLLVQFRTFQDQALARIPEA
jgi:hypothetical protein